MRTFTQRENQPQQRVSSSRVRINTAAPASHRADTGTASPHSGHGSSRISLHPPAAGAIQTKLEINQPGDEYEQEADHVAKQVMHMPELQLQRACPCGGGCPRCQREHPGHEHERLQRKRVRSSATPPPIVRDVLSSPGQPLDPVTRGFMELRFGHDFSRVRVHTGTLAEQSARDVMARAYTVGYDIVFGAGGFAPGTQEGRRLIAHELTHVVQQSGADGNSVAQHDENRGGSAISQSVVEGRGVARGVQRAPAPPAEIEMPKDPAGPIEPSAELAKFTKQPTYIDNNIKMVSFLYAEQAIIHYHDGSSFELGLVPRWMKPPIVEVDYHTPRWEYSLRHDKKEGISFIRQSDVRNAPRSMSLAEVQKRYAKSIDFFVQRGTGRIVPSRVNMLTAPNLCQVLLESEKKFVEQIRWVAEWGTEVAQVTGGMGGGGFVGGTGSRVTGRIGSRVAGRMATTPAARKLAAEMDNLLARGGSKTITVEGVVFDTVTVARQGNRLAVRRFGIGRASAPPVPGHSDVMRKAFEDAAVSVARINGLKTVTIDVGVIINPGWRQWLESIGYVFNRSEGSWIKTITL